MSGVIDQSIQDGMPYFVNKPADSYIRILNGEILEDIPAMQQIFSETHILITNVEFPLIAFDSDGLSSIFNSYAEILMTGKAFNL
jgi:hypothetical protein